MVLVVVVVVFVLKATPKAILWQTKKGRGGGGVVKLKPEHRIRVCFIALCVAVNEKKGILRLHLFVVITEQNGKTIFYAILENCKSFFCVFVQTKIKTIKNLCSRKR